MLNRTDESTFSAPTLGAHQVLASRFIVQDLVYETPRERIYRATDMRARQPVWVVFLQSKALSSLNYEQQSDLAETVFSRQREIQSSCFCFSEFYGIYHDEVFVVYPVPEGIRLGQYLAEQKPSLSTVSELFQRILSVLGKAHACGIIHLDLNPDSIFISRSVDEPLRVQIYGLGHAHLRAALGSNMSLMTKSGQTISQPEYLAPEVFSGKSADARSDVYSLGCMLYEAVSGAAPFSANSLIDLLLMHRQEPVPPPRGVDLGLPIVGLIRKMLAKQPDVRPQNVHEVIDELAHCEQIALAPFASPVPHAENGARTTELVELSAKILPLADQNGAVDYGRSVLFSRSMRPSVGTPSSRRSITKWGSGWWVRGVFVLLAVNLVALAALAALFLFNRFSSRPREEAQVIRDRAIQETSQVKPLGYPDPEIEQILSRVDAAKSGEKAEARASLGTNAQSAPDRPLPSELKPTEFPSLGFSAIALDPALASSMNLGVDQGLLIHRVVPDSRAYVAGMRKNDVIRRIESRGENILVWRPQPISTIEELERAVIWTVERDTRLALVIRRGDFDGLVVFVAPLNVPQPGPKPDSSARPAQQAKAARTAGQAPEADETVTPASEPKAQGGNKDSTVSVINK